MMRKRLLAVTLLVALSAPAPGCQPEAKSDASPSVPTRVAPVSDKQPWETEWDKTVAAARKEETFVVASSMAPLERDALRKGIFEKYGLNMEVITARPAQFIPKIQAERRAGIYSTDVLVAGISTVLATLAPAGELEPLDQFLVLPEVKNEALWFEGRLRFVDKSRNLLGMVSIPRRPLALNRDLVKTGEIQSYRDLLDPKWKGKMLISDPTIGGGGNATFQAIAEYIMDLDYLRELGNQEPVLIRDDRQMVEWLARGKYPLLLGHSDTITYEWIGAGAPITVMSPQEGTYVTISGYGLSVLKNAPHPAGARVFVNWMLSKEGQTILSNVALVPSLRNDVTKDHLSPEMRLNPGERYYWPDLDPNIAEKREHYRKIALDMWGHLIK